MMRTVRGWVLMMPQPYRDKLLHYWDTDHECLYSRLDGRRLAWENRMFDSASATLDSGFSWARTDEGMGYWDEVHDKLCDGRIILRDPEPTHWIYDVEIKH